MEDNKNFNLDEPQNNPDTDFEDAFVIGAGFQISDDTEEQGKKRTKKKRKMVHKDDE